MKTKIQPLNQSQIGLNLESVRQLFDNWRMTREKFGPIPSELWSAAVELTAIYPLTKVSQTLRLNYTDLKKRSKQSGSFLLPRKVGKSSGADKFFPAAFLDISGIGNPQSMDQESECSMEIRDGDGLSMKMHCRGESGVDILELCRIIMDSR